MSLTSWLCCMLLSLHAVTGMGLKSLQHVKWKLCLHLPWEHSGSVTDLSQGAAARLLRVVGDRWQPGGMVIHGIVLGRGEMPRG